MAYSSIVLLNKPLLFHFTKSTETFISYPCFLFSCISSMTSDGYSSCCFIDSFLIKKACSSFKIGLPSSWALPRINKNRPCSLSLTEQKKHTANREPYPKRQVIDDRKQLIAFIEKDSKAAYIKLEIIFISFNLRQFFHLLLGKHILNNYPFDEKFIHFLICSSIFAIGHCSGSLKASAHFGIY